MNLAKYPAIALAFLAPASLEANTYANQIEIQNCGGYQITKVSLSRYGSNGWSEAHCWGDCDDYSRPKLRVGDALCFNLIPHGQDGDVFVLRMFIYGGETKKSNETKFAADADQRRVFRMKGTSYNNNHPKSRGYKSTLPGPKCSKGGKKESRVNCTNIGFHGDDDAVPFGRDDNLARRAEG